MVIEQQAAPSTAAARRAMIDSQLRVSGVNDPAVLAAFDRVPREDFVPAGRRSVAYADRAVPLGGGRVLAPALTHGQMLVEAGVSPDDRVLVVGGGTGYLAAMVSGMCESVTVVESDDALAAMAPARSGTWVAGPLGKGAAKGAPYSLILIDGAVEQVPALLAGQLADDGRLITGLVENGVTRLATGRKAGGALALQALAEADFAPLAEFSAPRKWSF